MKYIKYAILIAAGKGTRMGVDTPKQFLTIHKKRILHYTFSKFIEAIPNINIILVLPDEYIDDWTYYCSENALHYPHTIVKGGFTRFHSVKNALQKVPDNTIVAIHDGVRPLVSCKLILNMFKNVEENNLESLIPVIPSVDTLRILDKQDDVLSCSDQTIDRSRVFAVQTPQLFKSELIKQAYSKPYKYEYTDDSSVAQQNNIKLNFCDGEKYNIKLTTKEDFQLAKLLL